jgi:tetratricopeptide (TPR) repeat protein
MGFFDHVMVRAQIAGKTYWMDGTRTSDRDLDSLKTPGFHWTLPERPAGAALIKLTPVASDQPDSVTTVRIDASAGLLAPATIHAEAWASGDSAEAMQQAFSALPAAERDKALRSAWEKSFPKLKITSSVGAMDEKTGVFKMTMDGSAPLEWDPPMSTGYKFLKFSDANLGWKPDYKRDPGPNIDAPYAVRYPAYNRYSLTLVLPRGGAGFAAPAPDVDVKVAGWALYRRSKIEKGVLTIEKSMKSLAPEFPASEADAAEKQLAELAKTQVFVRAPPGYVPTDADAALMAALEPKTAKEFIDRGDSYMQRRQYDKAIADFDKAIAADPKDSFGYSNRGIAHYWKGENDLAKADFAAAAKINGRDVVAVHGQGLLALRESRVPDAIAAFSRAVDLKENNSFALAYRAGAYLQIGDFDHALADLDELLRGDSTRVDTYLARADILRMKGDVAAALATLDDGLKANPGAEQIELHRAGLLAQTGKPAEAAKAFETLIKAHPSAQAYLTRARNREKIDVAGRLADVEAALKLDPKSGEALALRAEARADAGAAAQAVTELSEAMKTLKDDDQLLVARGKAYARSGDLKSADADLTRFAEKYAKNADALNEVCWTRATYGIDLKKALAECESSLALYPTSAAALDSRGFVLLRLGRYEEAVAAYAEALKLRPRQAESLYGRGLAELGLQRAKEGQADVAAARAISEKVVQEFADWGLKEAAAKASAPKDAAVKS